MLSLHWAARLQVVQGGGGLVVGRRRAVELADGEPDGGGDGGGSEPTTPRRPPVRAMPSPMRQRAPPAASQLAGPQFRQMLEARKGEVAAEEARLSAALHAAVRAADPAATQRAIDSGANVNTADGAGRTPLNNAADAAVVSVLVAAGARFTAGERGGTGGVRQLMPGEGAGPGGLGGVGIFAVKTPEPEPERLGADLTAEESHRWRHFIDRPEEHGGPVTSIPGAPPELRDADGRVLQPHERMALLRAGQPAPDEPRLAMGVGRRAGLEASAVVEQVKASPKVSKEQRQEARAQEQQEQLAAAGVYHDSEEQTAKREDDRKLRQLEAEIDGRKDGKGKKQKRHVPWYEDGKPPQPAADSKKSAAAKPFLSDHRSKAEQGEGVEVPGVSKELASAAMSGEDGALAMADERLSKGWEAERAARKKAAAIKKTCVLTGDQLAAWL